MFGSGTPPAPDDGSSVARTPCIFLLNVFASATFCSVASVVCNALINLVASGFRLLKAITRSFTLLLKAVFL